MSNDSTHREDAGQLWKREYRIVPAESAELRRQAKALVREYVVGLGIDLGFQDFEGEMARWPGEYRAPRGALLLAMHGDCAVGCVALGPLSQGQGELKRLYVRQAHRGKGLGEALVRAAIAEARRLGNARLRLDTLPCMTEAQALYIRVGFREIPASGHHPVPGTMCLELALQPEPSASRE